MGFPISAGLLDSMVLSVVDREDTYGYEITQFIRSAVDVSESTLYPVLQHIRAGVCGSFSGDGLLVVSRST